jgi:hypothetical protein
LIGNVSDSQTVEQLAETHSAADLLAQTRKREFASQKIWKRRWLKQEKLCGGESNC